MKRKELRWGIGVAACLIIGMTYLVQNTNYAAMIGIERSFTMFIMNKTIRFLINDLSCLALVAAIFNRSAYIRFSAFVFLIELFIMLPLYFWIKLSLEGDSEISSPLLSLWHRMIVNPLLMIVLIVGFFYQDLIVRKNQPSND